jgi:hypothetical protein
VIFHHESFEKRDSVNRTTLKVESYKYPRISWLWGRPNWTGAYVLNSVYDDHDRLTEKIFSWRSNSSISDGNLKTKTKIVHYSDSSLIVKIEYMIYKNYGRGGRTIFRKTVAWDKDEKKYKEVKAEN